MDWNASVLSSVFDFLKNYNIPDAETNIISQALRNKFSIVQTTPPLTIPLQLSTFPILQNGFNFRINYTRIPNGDVNVLLNRGTYGATIDAQRLYLNIHYIPRNMTACFEAWDKNYADEKNISIGLMESPYHKVRTVIQPNGNTVTFVTNREPTPEFMKKVFSILPKLYPIIETFDSPAIPKKYFMSLAAETADDWARQTITLIKSLNLAENHKIAVLRELFTSFNKDVIKALQEDSVRIQNRINDTIRNLQSYYADLTDVQTREFGLTYSETGENETVKETVDYFSKRDGIFSIYKGNNSTTLNLTLFAPVIFYDTEAAKTVLSNPRGSFYYYKDEPDFQFVMQALLDIFVNQKAKLYAQAKVQVNFSNGTTRAFPEFDENCKGMVNPHLYHYNCWGTNSLPITQATNRKDYIVLLEQLFASVGGLNFTDGVVISTLVRDLFERRSCTWEIDCIQDADNNWYSFKTYVEYVKTQTAPLPKDAIVPDALDYANEDDDDDDEEDE